MDNIDQLFSIRVAMLKNNLKSKKDISIITFFTFERTFAPKEYCASTALCSCSQKKQRCSNLRTYNRL